MTFTKCQIAQLIERIFMQHIYNQLTDTYSMIYALRETLTGISTGLKINEPAKVLNS